MRLLPTYSAGPSLSSILRVFGEYGPCYIAATLYQTYICMWNSTWNFQMVDEQEYDSVSDYCITHGDEEVDILLMTFPNAFCQMTFVVFWFRFHLRVFQRVLLTISRHQHYLNQRQPCCMHMCVTQSRWVKKSLPQNINPPIWTKPPLKSCNAVCMAVADGQVHIWRVTGISTSTTAMATYMVSVYY